MKIVRRTEPLTMKRFSDAFSFSHLFGASTCMRMVAYVSRARPRTLCMLLHTQHNLVGSRTKPRTLANLARHLLYVSALPSARCSLHALLGPHIPPMPFSLTRIRAQENCLADIFLLEDISCKYVLRIIFRHTKMSALIFY